MAKLFTEKSLLSRLLLLTLSLTLLLSTLTIGVWADEDYEVVAIEPTTMKVTTITYIRKTPSNADSLNLVGFSYSNREVIAIGEVLDENGTVTWYQIEKSDAITVKDYDGDCFIIASDLEAVAEGTEEPDPPTTTTEEQTQTPTTTTSEAAVTSVSEQTSTVTSTEEVEKSGDSSVNSGTVVLIIVCVILAAATIVLLVLYAKSMTSPKVVEVAKNPKEYLSVPQVGKLHNQGARSAQQDGFTVSPADAASSMGVLAIVADGMGGLEDGDKVSQKAVETALNTFVANTGEKYEALMWKMVVETNKAVNKMLGSSKIGKCGSTMVAGLIRQGKFMWFSIGDSRIYLWRDGSLIQLNREHIYRHDLELKVANGSGTLDAAFGAKDGSSLTSFFGRGELTHVDMPAEPLDIHGGDRYILMSDGVYNALSYEELVSCIATTNTAEETAEALGKAVAAKAYSNQDNYTAVVLEV
ncbi:MAG: serine/threonine-protein phosphatase [Oscillospiraceae bacterium]|nr:serine/threonine-protein phosphatase [Oscillospiraceae bacterium]